MSADIAANIDRIREQIALGCTRAGRNSDEVTLVAVSKTVTEREVACAIAAGVHDFGENRTNLLNERYAAFPEQHWHFIGSIQTNKVKEFVGKAVLVHSIASERALLSIAKRAELQGIVQPVLLEVNVSGEASKDGLLPAHLDALLQAAAGLSTIVVRGLMTMAPQGDLAIAQRTFAGLRQLRDRYQDLYRGVQSVQLMELSMGMSEDYAPAIEEGATIVRIGRSIWT